MKYKRIKKIAALIFSKYELLKYATFATEEDVFASPNRYIFLEIYGIYFIFSIIKYSSTGV